MSEKRYGLIGLQLEKSCSPEIHSLFGCRSYELLETEPHQLESVVGQRSLAGANVTMPHKQTVMKHCARLSPLAERIGSVNTVVRGEDGLLTGYNTDAGGLEYAARRAGISLDEGKVVILGSGGASRAAQYAARNADNIVIVSRSGVDNYQNLERHADAALLINATPVGAYPDPDKCPCSLDAFSALRGVIDMTYSPRRTLLLEQAAARDIPRTDGLPMLVHQAKLAEELFTGGVIPDSESDRVLEIIVRQRENIIIIGMPGSGKSRVAALLAAQKGRRHIDTDAIICERAGKAVPEIFAEMGEAAFRALEREAVALACGARGAVISVGGGAVLDGKNRAMMRRSGFICLLERRISELSVEGRPLSRGADLNAMYIQRKPYYDALRDAAVFNKEGQPNEAAEQVWRCFCENTRA